MAAAETEAVLAYVRAISVRTTKPHYYNMKQERSFTREQVEHAIKHGGLIEVHDDKAPEVRVLLRDSSGTCVVVSLNTGEVITVYYNDPEDRHYTLNKGLYRWKADMQEVVSKIRKEREGIAA